MTDKVNPSINRPAEAFKTAGAIGLAGGAYPGYVTQASSPSELSVQDGGISDTELNAFAEDHGKTFDVNSQDTSPQGVAFNNDGTLMYAVGAGTDSIYEYVLSTAYDVSTASLNDSLDVSASLSTPTPTGMAFNGDGTKLFVTDAANANVAEYALSTAYDVSTASLNSTTDVSAEDGSPQNIAFNNDGTLMYVVGDGTDSIYEYALSTAYDASTESLNDSLDVGAEDAAPNGMAIGDSGTLLYVIGASNDNIYEYTLSTAYDVSTASLNDSFDVSGQDTVPTGVTYFANGQDFVIIGEGSDSVYKYALEVDWDISTATYSDVVIDAGEAFVYGSWCAIDLRTTVALAASTNNQTVYVGWNKDGTDDVIVGLSSAFNNASGNTDQKIPLWDFDTDGSGVTAATDRRQIGKITSGSVDLDGGQLTDSTQGYLDLTGDGNNLRLATGQAIEDGGGAERLVFKSSQTTINNEDGVFAIRPRSDGVYLEARSNQPIILNDREGLFPAAQYFSSSSAPGTLELTNAQIDHGDHSITNFNNFIHSDSRNTIGFDDPTDGKLFIYYKPEAGSGPLLDLSPQAADLRLATGQAIEDGNGSSRCSLSGSQTEISDENGDPGLLLKGGVVNQLYAYNGQPLRVRDKEGSFSAVTYNTSASAPGTLELTNAFLDMAGNDILNASIGVNYNITFQNADTSFGEDSIIWPNQNGTTNFGIWGNTNGEIVSQDDAGNQTTLT